MESDQTDEDRQEDRVRRSLAESRRRTALSDEGQAVLRERHALLERERRSNLPDSQRVAERELHAQLEHERRETLPAGEQAAMRQRQQLIDQERVLSRTHDERESRREEQASRRAARTTDEVNDQLEQRRTQRQTRQYRVALVNQEFFNVAVIIGKNIVNGWHRLPDPSVVCVKCGAWKSALACCIGGKVLLPPLQPAPAFLLELMCDKIHRTNLRPYNMSVAFTSIGASYSNGQFVPVAENRDVQCQMGVYTLSIQGTLHHFIGSLLPYLGPTTGLPTDPKFAQIYVVELDKHGRAARRLGLFAGLDGVVLLQLGDMLEEHNPFARVFITMGERLRELSLGHLPPINVAFQLQVANPAVSRTYNAPTVTEVAAIMIEDGNGANSRDLLLFPRAGGLLRLFETQATYDPLQYPLLFPYGELGWHYNQEYADGAEYRKKRMMELREFVAFRLHQKKDDRSALHQGGRLFQQYVVDQWAKIEQERLRWVAANQHTIRADQYKGLRDALLNVGVVELRQNEGLVSTFDPHTGLSVHPEAGGHGGSGPPRPKSGHFLDQVGQRIVLPASFTGGERYMYEQYQDAMAIVREYGKPDLFMTVTCNPKWDEITSTIEGFGGPHQTAQDRPDIVARVWQQKLKAVVKDLDDGVLGRQIARIYVIEFQKRGLPHAHIWIILADIDKPKTRNDYDKFVSAKLPDPVENPALFQTVVTTMLHGPCGKNYPNSPCMNNGVCTKGFPKPFSPVTETNEDGYPKYRRRMLSVEIVFNNKTYDVRVNEWVVGNNPFFSQKYNCHINLEVCSTIIAVKYLYKYVYKGPDMAEVRTEPVEPNSHNQDGPRREPNEIVRYVKARYISPIEAPLRILEVPIQGKTHTVVMLEVHVPEEQLTTFRGNEDPQVVLDRSRHTKLTRFFELAAIDELARGMLYKDVPKLFRWDKKDRQWYRYKKQQRTIGRLVHCSLQDPQRHFLRVLLCHRLGPTSFEDLRTVDGYLCATFKKAALRAGYLENDEEWVRCLREASSFQMPYQLRQLFAAILLYCVPAISRALWDQFYEEFSGDYEYSFRNLVNREGMVKFKTLKSLHKFLASGSKTLADFDDLPQLSDFPALMHESLLHNALIRRELEGYDRGEFQRIVDSVDSLNADQRGTYNEIMEAAERGRSGEKLFFVDGPGGTGKSTLSTTFWPTSACRARLRLLLPRVVSLHYYFLGVVLHTRCSRFRSS